METYLIEKDIQLLYVEADSFPSGVGKAFEKLYSLIGNDSNRKAYGISFPDGKGSITYRAAIEQKDEEEAVKTGLGKFTVRKGTYISELLPDWKKDETVIGRTFHQLLNHPDIDKNGYCLEIYPDSKDVRCLVPLEANR